MNTSIATQGRPLRARAALFGLAAVIIFCVSLVPQIARADWHSLTGFLPANTSIATNSITISPDSRFVAFVSDMETDGVDELYVVPITGTTPLKLNPPLVEGGGVRTSIAFLPDGQHIVYLADQEVDNRIELYQVPVGGGEVTRLNAPLVAGGNVTRFEIDAKNEKVFYIADQLTNDKFELWSVPFGGGSSINYNGSMIADGDVSDFEIGPSSNRVIFTADATTDGLNELYSVPINSGTRQKLNPTITPTGTGAGVSNDFAPSGFLPITVFIARESGVSGGRVYSVQTATGSGLTQLSFNLLPTQRMLDMRIAPLGGRVLFNVGTNSGSTLAFSGVLHSNQIGAGAAAQVSDSADPLFGTRNYRFLPDGSRVIYTFQKSSTTTIDLVSATVTGERVTLYATDATNGPPSNFDFSPDSAWVVYRTTSTSGERRIFSITPLGTSRTNFGIADYLGMTPDGQRILYTRVVTEEGHTDLFSQQIFGGGERNLSRLHVPGSAFGATPSPDSKWIVFAVQIDGLVDLRVSDGLVGQLPIGSVVATNDGPKVVGASVAFSVTTTGGPVNSFTWNFGDGSSGSGASPNHTYTAAGVYTATVQAISAPNILSATTTVYVGDAVVEVTDNQYTPQHVTIDPGDTVVWVLKQGFHSVTANDGSFEQPAGNDWSPFVHTFAVAAAPGQDIVIPYYCTEHASHMTGSVTIRGEPPDDPDDPTPPGFRIHLPTIQGD